MYKITLLKSALQNSLINIKLHPNNLIKPSSSLKLNSTKYSTNLENKSINWEKVLNQKVSFIFGSILFHNFIKHFIRQENNYIENFKGSVLFLEDLVYSTHQIGGIYIHHVHLVTKNRGHLHLRDHPKNRIRMMIQKFHHF